MSATISAVPFLLIYAISGGVALATKAGVIIKDNVARIKNTSTEQIHFDNEMEEELLNQEFATNIVSAEVLVKTLEEHGAGDIIQEGECISCNCESFHIDFYKKDEPFFYLSIKYRETDKIEELLGDIESEYYINAQEVSYNKIKERLEQKNLEIENEEIYDDNTIVLTVNLE